MRAAPGGKHVRSQGLRLCRQCPEVRDLSHHLQTACRTEQADSRAAVREEASKW